MSERGRYRVYGIAFDMEGRTEGDFNDFRRNLDALEADFPGTHLLSNDETMRWPIVVVNEAPPTSASEES